MPKDIFLYDQTSSISRLPHSLKHLTVSPIPRAPIKQDQTILQENMLTSIINITNSSTQLPLAIPSAQRKTKSGIITQQQ
jgi:hypothetical protein